MSSLNRHIFVSTGSFGGKSVAEIVKSCAKAGLCNIELSSGASYQNEIYSLLKKAKDTTKQQFLIHNYFPPPPEPFVLNLASDDNRVLDLSLNHCRKAIDMAAELAAPFYSVHAGFCVHAGPEHLGRKLADLDRFSKKNATENFIESIKSLADYSAAKNVNILIENNVAASFNLVNGENELLLGVTSEELLVILNSVNRNNVGILLDVAHLKVSANTLGFCPEKFIRDLPDAIKAVHLSDNNGALDTNDQITENSWFWEPLLKYVSPEIVWILEVYNLSVKSITEQVALISTMTDQQFNNERGRNG